MRKVKKKAILLSLLVAAGMLLPANMAAQSQDVLGGLFGHETSTPTTLSGHGMMNHNRAYTGMELTVNTQDFGQEVPFCGGIFILIGAGLGYAVLKRKEDEQ